MDELHIPPSPSFQPLYTSTPDNGILYVAGLNKTIGFVSPPEPDSIRPLHVKILSLYPAEVLLLDCDPNWTNDAKHFAILAKNFRVSIWNLYNCKQFSSHKGHDTTDNSNSAYAMCYTNNHKVLSIVDNLCIKYCVKSNKYFKFPLKPKWAICIMKISPYDDNIVAAGTKHGLIIIMDSNDFSLLYTLRGHDTEIISMDWMQFKATKSEKNAEKICIASTSIYYNYIWLWDTKSRVGIKKIEMDTKYHIPCGFGANNNDNEPVLGNSICWLNNSMLAVLASTGEITICNISLMDDNRFEITKKKIDFHKKLEFCIVKNRSNYNNSRPTIWVFTHRKDRQLIFGDIHSNTFNIHAIYSTISITNYAIQESHLDQTKICIGGNGHKFHIIDIKNMTPNDFQFKTYIKDVMSKILSIAWHPNYKNYLAFATETNGVTMCDISASGQCRQIVLPSFTNNPIQQISWGYIDADPSNIQQQCVLFAVCHDKLVYYTEDKCTKSWKHFVTIKDTKNVCAVSAGKHFIAVCFTFGEIVLYSLQLKKLWSININSNITHCSWSLIAPNRLAVSSKLYIHLFTTYANNSSKDIAYEDGKLGAHTNVVNSVSWSQHNKNRLVSSSEDMTVRVWDTDKFECISCVKYLDSMHFAIFSPNDANLIMAIGYHETMHVFDLRKHNIFLRNTTKNQNINTINLKCNVGQENERQTNIDDCKNALTSAANISLASIKIQNNNASTLPLCNKAFTETSLQCLQSLMEQKTDDKLMLHTYLFSKRDDVKKLLEIELQNHQDKNTLTFSQVIMLQMCSNLKMEILKCVESKTLTEQHISLASSISIEFWKNCCKAYALQCIEKNMTLLAIPYLLGCHEMNESINLLCDAHFYREAWILAKFYKDDEDDIECFNLISNKWINYLESKGNLEGAALVAASVEDYGTAIRMLSKISNPCKKTNTILKWMKDMI